MPREFGDTGTSPTGEKCVSWDSWTNPSHLLLVEYPKDTKCISLVALMTQKAAPPATQVKICRTERARFIFQTRSPSRRPPRRDYANESYSLQLLGAWSAFPCLGIFTSRFSAEPTVGRLAKTLIVYVFLQNAWTRLFELCVRVIGKDAY